MYYFYKFYKYEFPQYIFKLVPFRQSSYTTRNTEKIPPFKTKGDFFNEKFFPSNVIEWKNVDHNIQNVGSFSAFKSNILKFVRPTANNVFNFENQRAVTLITRLRIDLSQLQEQKFKHSFPDALNLICSCSFDAESTSHYILHCLMYNDKRHSLLSTIKNIDCRLPDVTETILLKTLLFGNCNVVAHNNKNVLHATIE